MNRETELKKLKDSYPPPPSETFQKCLQHGVIFASTLRTDKVYTKPMSASVIVHHWNHSEFLPMLFESFEAADRKDIDLEFIITDSGSDDDNKKNVLELMEQYRNRFNIRFLYHDLEKIREKFDNENPDGAFHGFPYISNSALKYCTKDVHLIGDSSNIIGEGWFRGLCSPHYVFYKSKLIVRSRGGDFDPEVALDLKGKKFDRKYFELPHTYVGFGGGNGMGWSLKTEEVKRLGGFNQLLSCCGAVDDDLIYRCKEDDFQFIGHEAALAIHRPHYSGWEKKGRVPEYGYKKLVELHIDKTETRFLNEPVEPIEIYTNF